MAATAQNQEITLVNSEPLTDWQRRRLLIAAAASVMAGGPVRILSIRPVKAKADHWTRKGLGRRPPVRATAWQRLSTRPSAPGPEPQEVETIS